MLFWPVKHIAILSPLKKEEITRILTSETDQDQKSIYWGKRFYKKYWGKIEDEIFRIRPVVPYWNISPVEISGKMEDDTDEKNRVLLTMRCPYMRIVIPLVILAVGLFLINFGLKGELSVFVSATAIILISAYLLVNIPFQIQAIWSMKDLTEKLKGELTKLK
jgi:hypothetical protein